MANVNCTVYFRENGSSKIYSVEQAKGSYGIRWYQGERQRQKIIGQYPAGQYPAAAAAKLRKELELKKPAARQTQVSCRKNR